MPGSYLTSVIAWLPPGYDSDVVVPVSAVVAKLVRGSGRFVLFWRIYRDGQLVAQNERITNRTTLDEAIPEPMYFHWQGADGGWTGSGGFVEFGVQAIAEDGGTPPLIFSGGIVPARYAAYSAPGQKSFLLCVQYKFGDPRIIDQIARFGHFTDTYPAIHLDRQRGYGESLVFVNPYTKPLLVEIVGSDARRLQRQKVGPLSAHRVDLAGFLQPDESEWVGQVQITATNRVICYTLKHAFGDPSSITTVEHMDPFRADITHVPATQWLRLWLGEALTRFGRKRRTRETLPD